MKRIKNFFEKNVKLFLGILIGGVLVGESVYAATIIGAGEVSYTNNSQSNVGGALDELYTRASTWIDPSYIDFTTLATNTNETILASKNGLCIKRNNKVSCFKRNNWAEEQNHIQQVFSDIGCNVYSSHVRCVASDFNCGVGSDGDVYCFDRSVDSSCDVLSDGSVYCD